MGLVEVSPPYDPDGHHRHGRPPRRLRDAVRHGAAPHRQAGASRALVTELVAYADLHGDPLVRAALAGDAQAAERAMFAEPGGLAGAVARRVIGSAGPFARAARAGLADEARLRSPRPSSSGSAPRRTGCSCAIGGDAEPAGLAGRLAVGPGWGRHAADLAAFHEREGVGALAVNRVLRVDEAGLHGIVHADPIGLADLVGREELRADLLADLSAFTSGEPANDALLYGPPAPASRPPCAPRRRRSPTAACG